MRVTTGSLMLMLVLAACGGAPVATPTAPAAQPVATAVPPTVTAAPPPSAGPTVTVAMPADDPGTLTSLINRADPTLCAGRYPADFSNQALAATTSAQAAACTRSLRQWEAQAGEQQRTALNGDFCDLQPEARISGNPQRMGSSYALDTLATAYLRLGDTLATEGKPRLAAAAYQTVVDHFRCAWVYVRAPDGQSAEYRSAFNWALDGIQSVGG